MCQENFTKWTRDHGGRVRKTIPGTGKLVSTKKYTILADRHLLHKTLKATSVIKTAIRFKHIIVDYAYVMDSIAASLCKLFRETH